MKSLKFLLPAFSLFCIGLTGMKAQTYTDTRDGQIYKFVQIGDQVWMAENLKYLPSVVESGTGSQTTPYYYVYNYYGTDVAEAKATSNYQTYGVLYNWSAAMNSEVSSATNPSGVQGVCPNDWHLPSDTEWTQLIEYLGDESVSGGKLKEADTTHWSSPNTGATNESGFTALPGGCIDLGTFVGIGGYGYWWSATENGTGNAWYRHVTYDISNVLRFNDDKEMANSVRCVKDIIPTITNSVNSEETIIYANPTNEKLYCNYKYGTIMIFDLQGKQVLSKQMDSKPVDISNLRKGIYVVKLAGSENVLITKFVKD